MTNDPPALQERIAEELYYDRHPEGRHRSEWPAAVYPDDIYEYRDLAATVLPIIEKEVRAAKAEAWDEGCEAFEAAHKCDHIEPWGHLRDNPYRATETGDQR